MQRVYVGTSSMRGAIERYASKFNLLEVRPDPENPFSDRTLRRWRRSVPPVFAFSVVLPAAVTELRESEASDQALEAAIMAANLLESPVIVIANPISVTPTVANRKRMEKLVERIPHDVVKLAWEPPGLWEESDTRAIAAALDLVLVGDAARDRLAPGSVAYTRLRGLGDSRRLSLARMDKVIRHLEPFREVFVVIETDGPAAVAKAIRDAAAVHGDTRTPRVRHVEYPIQAEDEEQ